MDMSVKFVGKLKVNENLGSRLRGSIVIGSDCNGTSGIAGNDVVL